jgi:hypothetical protein
MTTALAEAPQLVGRELLEVDRSDIVFHNIGHDRVHIEFTVRNRGDGYCEPAHAHVEAAPLGAFVPWRPLATAPVPPLAPGESHQVRIEALRVTPAALGEPDRVSPQRLLAALGSGDRAARQGPTPGAWLLGHMLARHPRHVRPRAEAVATGPAELPPDLFELIGRSNPHWAGNLNVFVGRRSVERHLARALRVYPGRTNLAMFVVGTGPDAYAFRLAGQGAAWDAALYDATAGESLRIDFNRCPAIAEDQWIEVTSRRLMMLALRPPADCGLGSVAVHVTQQSTGKDAVVEFSLDPSAAAAGCYVV